MAEHAFFVVDEHPLAVHGDNRNVLSSDNAAVLEDFAAVHDVFTNLALIDGFLARLDIALGGQFSLLFIVQVFGGDLDWRLIRKRGQAEEMDFPLFYGDLIVLADVHHRWRVPVEAGQVLHLVEGGGVNVDTIGLFEILVRHRVDHPTLGRVRLVLALGVRIEEHRGIRIVDRLDANPLTVVVLVAFVLIFSPQAPGTKAPGGGLIECIVVGLVCIAFLLVGSIQPITGVGCFIAGRIIFGAKVDGYPVVPVLVENTHQTVEDFIHLKARSVFELLL